MMDYTDRHYRYFMRLLTRRTVLYTEMVVDNTILHGMLLQRLYETQLVLTSSSGSSSSGAPSAPRHMREPSSVAAWRQVLLLHCTACILLTTAIEQAAILRVWVKLCAALGSSATCMTNSTSIVVQRSGPAVVV